MPALLFGYVAKSGSHIRDSHSLKNDVAVMLLGHTIRAAIFLACFQEHRK